MPANVIRSPLAVDFALPDASTWTANFAGLPNKRLAFDLARGLASLVHPHGPIGSRHTASDYAVALRRFVTSLSESGFRGGAAELTIAPVLAFWLAQPYQHGFRTRLLLRAVDSTITPLDSNLQSHLYGRRIKPGPKSTPYQPYTTGEWERLKEFCSKTIESSWLRHQEMLELAKAGRSPRASAVTVKSLAWMMVRHGPMNHEGVERFLGRYLPPGSDGRNRYRPLVREVRESLFPTMDVQLAYRLQFGIQTGIVPDGLDDLGVGDIDWTGDANVLLSYVKGRTAGEGVTLSKDAVRTLKQWLEHSDPLRRVSAKKYRGSLWLAIHAVYDSARAVDANYTGGYLRTLVRRYGLVDDSGLPLRLHRGRIRATYHALLANRGWTGRMTIDPNHSATVEGDHYLSAPTPEQREVLDGVIEDGQSDLVRKVATPTVLVDDEITRLVTELPAAVTQWAQNAPTMEELVGGQNDVFVAACADQLAGLWGKKGQPCPARPWVCLMCPLAVFLPRHAPNLLRLKAFFARQFRQMPTAQFLQVFGPYADRLDTEILTRFPESVLLAATTAVSDFDDEVPLRPEEMTQ